MQEAMAHVLINCKAMNQRSTFASDQQQQSMEGVDSERSTTIVRGQRPQGTFADGDLACTACSFVAGVRFSALTHPTSNNGEKTTIIPAVLDSWVEEGVRLHQRWIQMGGRRSSMATTLEIIRLVSASIPDNLVTGTISHSGEENVQPEVNVNIKTLLQSMAPGSFASVTCGIHSIMVFCNPRNGEQGPYYSIFDNASNKYGARKS